MPDEMELAELVTFYKKGNVEDPANYKPIAEHNIQYIRGYSYKKITSGTR